MQIHHANARNIFPTGVRVYVSDLERSHRWYRDVLGLHMEMSDDGGCSVYAERFSEDVPVPIFWLIPGLSEHDTSRSVHLSFQVDDLNRTVKELMTFKVEIVSEPDLRPGIALQSAIILDPDGHAITLFSC